MNQDIAKNIRLKKFVREQIKQSLIKVGRSLVVEKGVEYLTARKLSEAANASIGIIYNIFSTMDNFIALENMQTLDDLYEELEAIVVGDDAYMNLNSYADVFSRFVLANKNLWLLLYNDLLYAKKLSVEYRKKIMKFEQLLFRQLNLMFGELKYSERKAALQVLGLSLFAVSGFLATDNNSNLRKLNKLNVCKLLLNTYLAGLQGLKKVKK